ncbi:MAG TPA: XcyI family restriction endonuclease [Nitrolancea sp.]|nr:XcyI family restriction endonuclease [Nitrolancea sp.]
MADPEIPVPDSSRQVGFHQLLLAARQKWLIDALQEALRDVDAPTLVSELRNYVPPDAHVILAVSGIPDEHLFPVPVLLATKPTLVAYYRLLLGLPQKTFYGTGSGMQRFRSMESGTLNNNQKRALPTFCTSMCAALADLVRQISPQITRSDVAELPILTLGQQFQGGNNNAIGRASTTAVFESVCEVIDRYVTKRTQTSVTVRNAAGRTFYVALAGDPDIRIQERVTNDLRNLLAIEIKGGTDRSNQHNRIGEAEKSHQKAKESGYGEFWTIIHTKTLDMDTARTESPTTNKWFDTAEIIARAGRTWEALERELTRVLLIPTDDKL